MIYLHTVMGIAVELGLVLNQNIHIFVNTLVILAIELAGHLAGCAPAVSGVGNGATLVAFVVVIWFKEKVELLGRGET